jgi:hypothetical protein
MGEGLLPPQAPTPDPARRAGLKAYPINPPSLQGRGLLCFALPLQGGDHSILFGDVLAGRKPCPRAKRRNGQCRGLRPQIVKPSGVGFIQFPAQRRVDDGVDGFRRPWLHEGLHTRAAPKAQVYLV